MIHLPTHLRSAMAAGLVATLLAGSAPARADLNQLLEEVAKAAPQVGYYGDEVSMSAQWIDVERGEQKVTSCLAAVDAAVAGGAKLNQEVELTYGGGSDIPTTRTADHKSGGTIRYTTLATIKKFCAAKRAKVQLIRTYFAVREAERNLSRIERVKNVEYLLLVAMAQRLCTQEVARALKLKNPPTIAFHRPDVTLGQAVAKVCDPLDQALAKVRDQLRQEVDLTKFYAVLSGDRRKVFDDNLLHAGAVFGESKYKLATPDDFENLDDWYVVSPDQGRFGQDAWRVTHYHFEGARLTATETRTGPGREPPKDAFAPRAPTPPTAEPSLE